MSENTSALSKEEGLFAVCLLAAFADGGASDGERAEWAYDSDTPENNIYLWYEGRASDYPNANPPGSGGYVGNMSTGYAPPFWDATVRRLGVVFDTPSGGNAGCCGRQSASLSSGRDQSMSLLLPESVDAVIELLAAENYVCDRQLATALFLSLKLSRPLSVKPPCS